MKILVIPDIHGTTEWQRAEEFLDKVGKIIFLGDYFDSFKIKAPAQISNFKKIIAFKNKYPENIDLCLANHDSSYLNEERCSGYQWNHYVDIYEVLNKAKHLFEAVYIYDKWIFSHAGVSSNWMRCCGIKDVNEINELYKTRPNFFRWVGPDGYGDNHNEGPLWIRPRALRDTAVKGYNQCFGHSESYDSPIEIINDNKDKLLLIDSPAHDCLVIVDTENNTWERA